MFELLESRRLLADVLAQYIYGGDAVMDGSVSGDDYSAIDFNVILNGNSGWYNGDFNYDGIISSDELGLPQSDFSGTAKDDVIIVSTAESGAGQISVNGKISSISFMRLVIHANGGDDKIHIALGEEFAPLPITIYGGAGDDTIVGSACAERIIAGDGNDLVNGMGGRDTIYAEGGDDSIRGGGSSDLLDGGVGNDTVRGDAGNDRLLGGDGFDRLRGSAGNDSCEGGASKDFIGGETGDDQLTGDGGDDVIAGGEGDDIVVGGAGTDQCDGNAGDDVLAGGSGEDRLLGAEGNDGFDPGDADHECLDIETADLEPGAASFTAINTVSSNAGLTKTGGGTLILTGANSYASSATVNATTGKIDIKDNKLIVNSGSGSGAEGLVQSGYTSGAWSGITGIVTSVTDAAVGLNTIGIATGNDLGLGTGQTCVWAGQTITADSVLVMYTYAGDANLDGTISGDDYSTIDFGSLTGGGTNGWVQGDFNYDGVIDSDDDLIIDQNLSGSGNPVGSGTPSGVTAAG